MSLTRPPWENGDGSTNVPAFLAAYKADDNVFWATGIGHIQNVLDDRIDALDEAEATITGLREALDQNTRALGWALQFVTDRDRKNQAVEEMYQASKQVRRHGRDLIDAAARPEFPDTEKG